MDGATAQQPPNGQLLGSGRSIPDVLYLAIPPPRDGWRGPGHYKIPEKRGVYKKQIQNELCAKRNTHDCDGKFFGGGDGVGARQRQPETKKTPKIAYAALKRDD